MSGIASAASTIPGSVATLRSWSSDLSAAIASRICSSANTRAGTRISPSAGISQSVSSTFRSSDIEHHLRAPSFAGRLELEAMVGDGLHQRSRLGHASPHDRVQGGAVELEVGLSGDETCGVGQKEQLLEPGYEQRGKVAALEPDRARLRLSGGAVEPLRGRLR